MNYRELTDENLIKFIEDKMASYSSTISKMQENINYYKGKHDILKKRRIVIGKEGKPSTINNLPNSRIVDNQFKKAVNQKVSYLFSNEPTVTCDEDEQYQEQVKEDIYNKKSMRTLNKTALDSYLCSIAWWYIYIDETGQELKFKKMDPVEIIPVWEDSSHESLSAVIRPYVEEYVEEGKIKKKERLDFYTDEEIIQFERENGGKLKKVDSVAYISTEDEKYYSFGKIPFVYFKSNSMEETLLDRCKTLQDAINTILSNFQDNMLEDPRNTIIVLKNYDGQDLGEFRQNLAQYGAVKVRTEDGSQGGVDTLQVDVNSENYKAILEILKEKLIENVAGIDGKNNRSSNAPNELNIKLMYSDISLDANATELEFQASLSHLEYFYKKIKGVNDAKLECDIKFNRNEMVMESAVVENVAKLTGILSREGQLEKIPGIDPQIELERLKGEEEQEVEDRVYPPNLFDRFKEE